MSTPRVGLLLAAAFVEAQVCADNSRGDLGGYEEGDDAVLAAIAAGAAHGFLFRAAETAYDLGLAHGRKVAR